MWPPSVLSRETRALADFLCSAHDAGCRVKKLKGTALHARLRALWRGGFVVKGTFIPSPEALDYWRKRRDKRNSAPIAQEPEEPPTPTAASGGGGAARKRKAPPPKRTYKRKTEAPLGDLRYAINRPEHAPADAGAAEVPNEPRPPSVDFSRPTGAELADQLTAWCKSSGASQIRLSLHLFGSNGAIDKLRNSQRPKQSTIDRVRAFLNDPVPPEKLPKRSKPVRAPRINPAPRVDRDDPVKAARRAQAFKNTTRRQARAALDAGLTPTQASPNQGVRGAMRELRENDEAQRRATCPVEQAKTLIRRKGYNCFDANVILGEKAGHGKFVIGTKVVNEEELLAYAERCRA